MPAGPGGASACPLKPAGTSLDVFLNSHPEGFPRRFRLTQAREFNRVFRTGTLRRRHGALRLSAVANRMHTARLGLVVGRRALPRAHERNRAKRVLRETFRRVRATLPAMDIVVQVTGDAGNEAYRASLLALLSQLNAGPTTGPDK